jgi:hypothetical protein
MATYTVNLNLGRSTPPDDTTEATEAAEAATPFDSWLDWLGEAREAIDEGGGDPDDDLDSLLAIVLEHLVGGGPDAIAVKEERIEEVLRQAKDSNNKITVFLHRQREARKTRAAESAAFTERLDGLANALTAAAQENAALRSSLSAIEQNLAQATAMLEREISKERSLRRLLDAQRNRPHTQRVASELAKRHAMKALESATKSNKVEAA